MSVARVAVSVLLIVSNVVVIRVIHCPECVGKPARAARYTGFRHSPAVARVEASRALHYSPTSQARERPGVYQVSHVFYGKCYEWLQLPVTLEAVYDMLSVCRRLNNMFYMARCIW